MHYWFCRLRALEYHAYNVDFRIKLSSALCSTFRTRGENTEVIVRTLLHLENCNGFDYNRPGRTIEVSLEHILTCN